MKIHDAAMVAPISEEQRASITIQPSRMSVAEGVFEEEVHFPGYEQIDWLLVAFFGLDIFVKVRRALVLLPPRP